MGTFAQVDPIDVTPERLIDPQQLNPYAYTRGNPLKFTDPTGKQAAAGQEKQLYGLQNSFAEAGRVAAEMGSTMSESEKTELALDVATYAASWFGGIYLRAIAIGYNFGKAAAYSEATGDPMYALEAAMQSFNTPLLPKPNMKFTGEDGQRYEKQIVEKYKDEQVGPPGEIIYKDGKRWTDIDAQTSTHIIEAGLSLQGKSTQLEKLADIAKERNKTLRIYYDPRSAGINGRIRELSKTLSKKFDKYEFVQQEIRDTFKKPSQ